MVNDDGDCFEPDVEFDLDLCDGFSSATEVIRGDLPEFQDEMRRFDLSTVSEVDFALKRIPPEAARRHFTRCGVQSISSNPHAHSIRPTTTLLLILDIDETLVDARSAPPAVHIRPGVAALFARLAELRRSGGLEVWFWTAALDVHAARCVGILRHAVGDLPVDAVVVRGPEWMSPTCCLKDTRGLRLAAADRVLLVDNTPAMVLAAPHSALVVPSYTHVERHATESRHPRPTLSRVGDVVQALVEAPTARVATFLAGAAASNVGVRPWAMAQCRLQLLYDLETAPAQALAADRIPPAPLTIPPSTSAVVPTPTVVKVC